jgi:hypothetical protein
MSFFAYMIVGPAGEKYLHSIRETPESSWRAFVNAPDLSPGEIAWRIHCWHKRGWKLQKVEMIYLDLQLSDNPPSISSTDNRSPKA